MKTDLQKQLQEAEIEKLRAIDKFNQIKAQIEETNKEPSIFELMPIGSVWCRHEVINHDRDSWRNSIKLLSRFGSWTSWPTLKQLRELIAEQQKLDAMKMAADAALKYAKTNCNTLQHLISEYQDYETIIEQENK